MIVSRGTTGTASPVVSLAAACSDRSASPDAGPFDGATGCVPSGVSEGEASRPTEPELAFGLVFDTHSVDLLAFDIAAAARVETSDGAELTAGFAWAPGSEGSHHRDGVLTAPAPPLDGASWLRLTIDEVAGVDRVFEWDETFLVHDLP